MEKRTVGICCDHAGYEMKAFLKVCMEEWNIECLDYGTHSTESCDYPDFAHAMAQGIEKGEASMGIAICGTGNGIAMTLNKHQQIRAALCWKEELAILARGHNDANVVVLPGRFISDSEAKTIIQAFLASPFEGNRHMRRVEKIAL